MGEIPIGIRSMMIAAYEIPRSYYVSGFEPRHKRKRRSATAKMTDLGIMVWYGSVHSHTGRKRRPKVDINVMVERWHRAVVGLAVAHSKDEADRFEASIEECLTPILSAPVAQIREFAPKLLESLKSDPTVPFLVWRAYEVWVEMMKTAPDEDVKVLKRELAAQIVEMVETDAKAQLPEAMIRALQWRSPEKLEEVKQVVEQEKAAGRSVRLKGRESCLFLEAGGTEDEPKVCIQV